MKPRDWAKIGWMLGGVIFLVGEGISAFDGRKGNTASEFWRDLPEPARYGIFGALCAVLSHWVWPLPMPTIIEHAENVTVEAQHSDA